MRRLTYSTTPAGARENTTSVEGVLSSGLAKPSSVYPLAILCPAAQAALFMHILPTSL